MYANPVTVRYVVLHITPLYLESYIFSENQR